MFIPTTLSQSDLLAMPKAQLAGIRQACLRDLDRLRPDRVDDKPYYRESKQMLLAVDSLLGYS